MAFRIHTEKDRAVRTILIKNWDLIPWICFQLQPTGAAEVTRVRKPPQRRVPYDSGVPIHLQGRSHRTDCWSGDSHNWIATTADLFPNEALRRRTKIPSRHNASLRRWSTIRLLCGALHRRKRNYCEQPYPPTTP